MAVTNCNTVNGEVIAEFTTGPNRLNPLQDALGDVCQEPNAQNSAKYEPGSVDLNVIGTVPKHGWAEGEVNTSASPPTEVIDLRHLFIDVTILPNQSITDSPRQNENHSPNLTAAEVGDFRDFQGRS